MRSLLPLAALAIGATACVEPAAHGTWQSADLDDNWAFVARAAKEDVRVWLSVPLAGRAEPSRLTVEATNEASNPGGDIYEATVQRTGTQNWWFYFEPTVDGPTPIGIDCSLDPNAVTGKGYTLSTDRAITTQEMHCAGTAGDDVLSVRFLRTLPEGYGG